MDITYVKAVFGSLRKTRTQPVYRDDHDLILQLVGVKGLPVHFQAHFANSEYGTAVVMMGSDGEVSIPNTLLATGLPVYCWILVEQGISGAVRYSVQIPVRQKARPDGTIPPEQADIISQAISALNDAGTAAQEAADSAAQSAADAADSAASANADAQTVSDAKTYVREQAGIIAETRAYIEENVAGFNDKVSTAISDVEETGAAQKNLAKAQAENSEAWAVGKRNWVDVPSSDGTYHNNAKWYAEKASESAEEAAISARSWHTKVNIPLSGSSPVYGEPGQHLVTRGNGITEWADAGLPTDEQTAQAVEAWLDGHPEATTAVQDGSLTQNKFSSALKLVALKDYVTPEMFGAVGDGVTNDTTAIQNAVDNADNVYFLKGKNYLITTPILVNSNQHINGNGATIVNRSACRCIGKKTSFIDNVVIENLKFVGNGASDTSGTWPNINSAIIIATNVTNIIVKNCEFVDFRYGVFIGGEGGENATIESCIFKNCQNAINTFVSNKGYILDSNFYDCETPIQLEANYNMIVNDFEIIGNKTFGTIGTYSLNLHNKINKIHVCNNIFDARLICSGSNITDVKIYNNNIGSCALGGEVTLANNIINGASNLEAGFNGIVINNYIDSPTHAFQSSSQNLKFINNTAKVGTAFLVGGAGTVILIGLRLLSGSIASSINWTDVVFYDYCGVATPSYANYTNKLNTDYKYWNPPT